MTVWRSLCDSAMLGQNGGVFWCHTGVYACDYLEEVLFNTTMFFNWFHFSFDCENFIVCVPNNLLMTMLMSVSLS